MAKINEWFQLFYIAVLAIDAGVIAGVIAAIWIL